jgi:hypothetical protein
MQNHSKPIKRADDASKKLIMELLGDENTYGFDIDSIFYIEDEDLWVVIEFLKTDHKKLSPKNSHPNRYWDKNWRKFYALWRLVQALRNAELYLVNYEDEDHARSQGREEREFLVINVKNVTPGPKSSGGGLEGGNIGPMNFAGMQQWYQDINNRARKK